jgi:hypothetical protein
VSDKEKLASKRNRISLTFQEPISIKLKVTETDPTDNLISRLREKISHKEQHEK